MGTIGQASIDLVKSSKAICSASEIVRHSTCLSSPPSQFLRKIYKIYIACLSYMYKVLCHMHYVNYMWDAAKSSIYRPNQNQLMESYKYNIYLGALKVLMNITQN